jgi:hypothetical protein
MVTAAAQVTKLAQPSRTFKPLTFLLKTTSVDSSWVLPSLGFSCLQYVAGISRQSAISHEGGEVRLHNPWSQPWRCTVCDFNVAPTRHVLIKAPLIADEAFKWKPVGRACVVDGVMHREVIEIAREEKDIKLI